MSRWDQLKQLEDNLDMQADIIRKQARAARLIYAELQQKVPNLDECQRLLGEAYPGGITALIKGANGKCGRQNGS